MTLHRFVAGFAACLLAILPAPLAAQQQTTYELTPLELPAELTGLVRAMDINNRGDVLGWLFTERRVGVVVDRNGVRTFTVPGAVYMEPDAILANGTIAIHYYDLSGNRGPFLLDRKGRLTPLVVEGDWDFVNVWDVSDNGIAAGEVWTSGPLFRTFGFVQDRKQTRIIECPGARFTGINAVNNQGTAGGACSGDFGNARFLVSRDGSMTELSGPGGMIIYPEAINNRGVLGVSWVDLLNAGAGVFDDGVLTPIEYPAPATIVYQDPETGTTLELSLYSSYTRVSGINDRREIAGFTEGTYYDANFTVEVVRVFSFTGRPVQ